MQIGIFAKTFVRPTLEETLDAVKAHGLGCVQFNMVCAGLPSMPDCIESAHCDTIRREMSLAEHYDGSSVRYIQHDSPRHSETPHRATTAACTRVCLRTARHIGDYAVYRHAGYGKYVASSP